VARILLWKSCKFGEKICYSNWDNEFFLRDCFLLAHPVDISYTVSTQLFTRVWATWSILYHCKRYLLWTMNYKPASLLCRLPSRLPPNPRFSQSFLSVRLGFCRPLCLFANCIHLSTYIYLRLQTIFTYLHTHLRPEQTESCEWEMG